MSSSDPIVRVEGLVKDFWPGFGLRRKGLRNQVVILLPKASRELGVEHLRDLVVVESVA